MALASAVLSRQLKDGFSFTLLYWPELAAGPQIATVCQWVTTCTGLPPTFGQHFLQ